MNKLTDFPEDLLKIQLQAVIKFKTELLEHVRELEKYPEMATLLSDRIHGYKIDISNLELSEIQISTALATVGLTNRIMSN